MSGGFGSFGGGGGASSGSVKAGFGGGSGFAGGSSGGNSGFGGGSGFGGNSGGGSGFGGNSGGGSGFGGGSSGGSGFGGGSGGGYSGFGGSSGSGFGGSGGSGGGFGGSSGGGFGGSSGGGFGGSGGSGGGFGGESSGGFGAESGGGGERPRGCFNCGQEGHRSADCPEPKKERNNGCFNCGQEGHRSSDCPEPRKERSNSCFNCKEEGHRSADCPHPPRERKCFNCGNDGHSSNDCPEPPNPDRKPASTHVPEDYESNKDALYAEHIEQGAMFDKFFDQKVELSLGCGKKLSGNEVQKIETFEELGFGALMATNVSKAGYSRPTPIQKYAMKSILEGKDLMACSQTGSGKTAAFLLPIMSKLVQTNDLSNITEAVCSPRVLILAPTRELAIQIHKEATKFSSGTMCKCEILYGGTSVRYQKERVQKGATILVGTTGRIKHFIQEGIISLSETKYLILDEADRMLDMGFSEDINQIIANGGLRPKDERQTLMFSATFPASVQGLVKELLKDEYLMIVVDKIGAANKCITQNFEQVDRFGKKKKLIELLGIDMNKYKQNQSMDVFKQKTLVFVSSKKMADALGVFLSENALPTTTIHGDREQAQREAALNDFRRGKTPVLIATAVAERGLDISGVDHVINFDMPKEIDEYIHRIGRTGRVGNAGMSTSFIDPEHDSALIQPLLTILEEAGQLPPEWLKEVGGGSFNNGDGNAEGGWNDDGGSGGGGW